VPSLALAHVLLVVTFRPGFSAPGSGAAHASHVVLRPLSQPHSAAVLDAALGSGKLSAEFTALVLNNLASLLQAKGDYAAAEALYRRALAIFQKPLGEDRPNTRKARGNLENFLQVSGARR
jgi:tetratricopeptide (TPR) repeat protein